MRSIRSVAGAVRRRLGGAAATLPGAVDARGEPSGAVVQVYRAAWETPDTWCAEGWAYRLGDAAGTPADAVVLVDDAGTVVAEAEQRTAPEANRASKVPRKDVSRAGWRLRLDAVAVEALGPGTAELRLEARWGEGATTTRSAATRRYGWGSASQLTAGRLGGRLVVPRWDEHAGLVIDVRTPAFSCGAPRTDGDDVVLPLECSPGWEPYSLGWDGASGAPEGLVATLERSDDGSPSIRLLSLDPGDASQDGTWALAAFDAAGRRRLVHWTEGRAGDEWPLSHAETQLVNGPGGVLRVAAGRNTTVTTAAVSDDGRCLSLGGVAGERPVVTVWLEGPRASTSRTRAEGSAKPGQPFEATIALDAPDWWGTARPLPQGGYRLKVELDDGEVVVPPLGLAVGRDTPVESTTPRAAYRLERHPGGGLYLDVAPPLAPSEVGRAAQARLGRRSAKAPHTLDGLYLESWFGKSFSDNPAALVEELRRRWPSQRLVVGVADLSVALPEGVEPLVVGTTAWWEYVSSAAVLVSNSWFPTGLKKTAGQVWAQTWHGTPLKLLGLDRPSRAGNDASRRKLAGDAALWDVLVSQNPHSTAVFRRAYGYEGRVLEGGYPRNDILAGDAAAVRREEVRRRLGIGPDTWAVLYAPTFRDAHKDRAGMLEPSELARVMGPGSTLLLRGHSVTLRRGEDAHAEGVVDVTSYPETADLILASDCLVTDYSSVMFDYSVTGKPIVFYTPDYDEYTGGGRGAYFDLRKNAPGPLATTTRALRTALEAARAGVTDDHAERYAAWRREFNPGDDGAAGRRLVAAIDEIRASRED